MIRNAVILAAGLGSRLASSHVGPREFSKPLLEVGGRTLLGHVLRACAGAGVERAVVVTGFAREQVEAEARRHPGISVVLCHNPRWEEPNGRSVLAAAPHVSGEFLLLMADHLFDPGILGVLDAHRGDPGVTLAVDPRIESIFDLDDATKVRREGDRIVAIGKNLARYDAIDCGLFRCTPELFPAIEAAARVRPPSLSEGLGVLVGEGSFRAVEIGDRWWQDVDTPEMARAALQLLQRVQDPT